jgi:hypothetical protein
MTDAAADAPVACSLERDALTDRSMRWEGLCARAGIEVATTEQGLRLVFERAAGVGEELRELTELERECCAFADWTARARRPRGRRTERGGNRRGAGDVRRPALGARCTPPLTRARSH